MADPVTGGFLPFVLTNFPSPTFRVGERDQQAQISLENANFNLEPNRKVLFGGNGQISAVGDISFLTGAPSPVEQLRIFANGNVGIGTGTRQPTDKLEIAGSLKLETGLSVNQFSGEIADSDQVVPTAKAVKTYVDSKLSPELPDGSVTDRKIANDAITTDKIADDSITAAKIKKGAIAREKLDPSISFDPADDTVTTPKIKDGAVTETKIKDGSITAAKLNFSISPGGSQWSDLSDDSIYYSKGNVGIGTGTSIPQAKLQVANGAIMPSAGNSETSGIMFPKDAFGGGGDAAWMRYYARTGEATTLEIGTSNDPDDHIALMPSLGNVGIGTRNPQDKLDVAGNLRILTDSNPIRFTSTWSDFSSGSQSSAKNHAEISNDTEQFKTLMIVGNKSAGGVRRVSVWDKLEVNGDLSVSNTIKADKLVVNSLQIKGFKGGVEYTLEISLDTRGKDANWIFKLTPNKSQQNHYFVAQAVAEGRGDPNGAPHFFNFSEPPN